MSDNINKLFDRNRRNIEPWKLLLTQHLLRALEIYSGGNVRIFHLKVDPREDAANSADEYHFYFTAHVVGQKFLEGVPYTIEGCFTMAQRDEYGLWGVTQRCGWFEVVGDVLGRFPHQEYCRRFDVGLMYEGYSYNDGPVMIQVLESEPKHPKSDGKMRSGTGLHDRTVA